MVAMPHDSQVDDLTPDPQLIMRNIPEAARAAALLMDDIQSIDAQLSSRDREINGVRLNAAEYWDWRQRAIWAKTSKVRQYRALKTALHQARMALRGDDAGAVNPYHVGDAMERDERLAVSCAKHGRKLGRCLTSLRDELADDVDIAEIVTDALGLLDEMEVLLRDRGLLTNDDA